MYVQAREPCSWRPLIIMVPMRLSASDKINPHYIPKLAAYLSFPQSLVCLSACVSVSVS